MTPVEQFDDAGDEQRCPCPKVGAGVGERERSPVVAAAGPTTNSASAAGVVGTIVGAEPAVGLLEDGRNVLLAE